MESYLFVIEQSLTEICETLLKKVRETAELDYINIDLLRIAEDFNQDLLLAKSRFFLENHRQDVIGTLSEQTNGIISSLRCRVHKIDNKDDILLEIEARKLGQPLEFIKEAIGLMNLKWDGAITADDYKESLGILRQKNNRSSTDASELQVSPDGIMVNNTSSIRSNIEMINNSEGGGSLANFQSSHVALALAYVALSKSNRQVFHNNERMLPRSVIKVVFPNTRVYEDCRSWCIDRNGRTLKVIPLENAYEILNIWKDDLSLIKLVFIDIVSNDVNTAIGNVLEDLKIANLRV